MRRARPIVSLALAAALLAGCGGGGGAAPEPTATHAAAGACDRARPATTVDPPKGLVVPDGLLVAAVQDQPPNQRASGFVPLTPAAFVAFVEHHDKLGVLFKDNEGEEAEVMVSDGRQRAFWKLVRACPNGSSFTVLTGKEHAPGAARDAIRKKRKAATS